jgi:hypothetical protein
MVVKVSALRENENSERIKFENLLKEENELIKVVVLVSLTLVLIPMLDCCDCIVGIHDNSYHKIKHDQCHKHH